MIPLGGCCSCNDMRSFGMASALERMIYEDAERGVDVRKFEVIVTGKPLPRIDKTIRAAPLGWTPEDQEGTPA